MKSNRIHAELIGAVAIASLAVAAGCDVKDPIYDTPHPEHGTVTLTADWSGIGRGLTAPASYTVAATPAAGGGNGRVTRLPSHGTTATLDHLFEPGMYRCPCLQHAGAHRRHRLRGKRLRSCGQRLAQDRRAHSWATLRAGCSLRLRMPR